MPGGTITIADVLEHIRDRLEWTGPGGRKMGHIVLTYDEAVYLRAWALTLIKERDDLVSQVQYWQEGEQMATGNLPRSKP